MNEISRVVNNYLEIPQQRAENKNKGKNYLLKTPIQDSVSFGNTSKNYDNKSNNDFKWTVGLSAAALAVISGVLLYRNSAKSAQKVQETVTDGAEKAKNFIEELKLKNKKIFEEFRQSEIKTLKVNDEDGKLFKSYSYKNGEKSLEEVTYRNNGQLFEKTKINPDGTKEYYTYNPEGKLDGYTKYYASGEIKEEKSLEPVTGYSEYSKFNEKGQHIYIETYNPQKNEIIKTSIKPQSGSTIKEKIITLEDYKLKPLSDDGETLLPEMPFDPSKSASTKRLKNTLSIDNGTKTEEIKPKNIIEYKNFTDSNGNKISETYENKNDGTKMLTQMEKYNKDLDKQGEKQLLEKIIYSRKTGKIASSKIYDEKTKGFKIYSYDDDGKIFKQTLPNGSQEYYTYDKKGSLIKTETIINEPDKTLTIINEFEVNKLAPKRDLKKT